MKKVILCPNPYRDNDLKVAKQSKEMLELVFQTRSFDPGQYWLNDSLGFFLTVQEQGVRNISSFWAGLETKGETGIETFNKKIDQLS